MGIVLGILFVLAIFYSVLYYLVDSFLKKRYEPNKEYLEEVKNLRFNSIKSIIVTVTCLIILVVKRKMLIIIGIPVLIICEMINFLLILKELKCRNDSSNTMKYFVFRTLFFVLAVILSVAYFYFKILS